MRDYVDDAGPPLSVAEVARQLRLCGRDRSVETVGRVGVAWEYRPPDAVAVAHPTLVGPLGLLRGVAPPDLLGWVAPGAASYTVKVEKTPLPNGGERWWWLCPSCDRRCGLLYVRNPRPRLACRRCHGLKYRSQYRRVLPTDPRDWVCRLGAVGTRRHAGIRRAGHRG